MKYAIPLLSCVFSCLLLACLASPVRAQFGGAEDTDPSLNATSSFGIDNPQLKDLLHLQYQIQLLKKLVQYEESVNKIVAGSINIGVTDPVIPSPDKTICALIPANIPCAQAYHGLYENYSVQAEAAPASNLPPAASIAASIPALEGDAMDELPNAGAAAPAIETASLFWTDITCLAQKCSAIISPDVANPKARYRIKPGQTLPDGSSIHTISAAGVTIERNKELITLAPAPQA